MEKIVTKEILDIHDKYDEDFGLLDEPWAKKRIETKLITNNLKRLVIILISLSFLKLKMLVPN